jgi:integrase
MATFRMSYVKSYKDRHGKRRYYFRRPGRPSVALPGEPGSVEFAKAYEDAASVLPCKIGEDRVAPGSWSAVIAEYYESTQYQRLKDVTKSSYRNAIERFRKDFGKEPVKDLTPELLDDILSALAHKPGTQGHLRKVLNLILNMAVRRRVIATNPMTGVRLPRKAVKGFVAWSEADIAAYEERWPNGSRERLALALLLYTGQRRSDVILMGRQHVKDGRIFVKQQKTGAELWIALHPVLKAEIDAAPKDHLNLVTTQYGEPFTSAGFGNWFGEKARAAGLVARTAHGLRKAAARRLAEAGCTPNQIMAVTGHQNLSEVTLYTASVDQSRLADEAIARTNLTNP